MLTIAFDPWVIQGNTAIANFRVEDHFGDGIARVRARAYRRGDPLPPLIDAPDYMASVDIRQYGGDVLVDLQVTDLLGSTQNVTDVFRVSNFLSPLPPDFLGYSAFTPLGIVMSWGLLNPSPIVASWRVINTPRTGAPVVLAEVPVAQRSVAIAANTSTFYRLSIVGVDSLGNAGAPGPALIFASDVGGPTIALADLVLTGSAAVASWDIGSREIVTDINWQFSATGHTADDQGVLSPFALTTRGKGIPVDTARLTFGHFQGVVAFMLSATDLQGRETTVSKQLLIYLVAPHVPTLVVTSPGIHSLTVRVTPDPLDMGVTAIEIYAPGGSVVVPAPFERTFTGLTASTRYSFAARSLNASGLAGPISAPVQAQTFDDPHPAPIVAPNYQGGPLLPYLLPLLTDDLRHYILQLFTDGRIRQPLAPQLVTPPNGFDAVLEYMRRVGPFFGQVLRTEANDPATHAVSLLVDKTADPLAKLALFCERLEFGNVWNPG